MALTLGSLAHGRDNNFNLVRLLAAALVLVSHSWPLTATPGEPLERLAGFSLGHLGVDMFFVVSGFLVTGSLLARPTLASFARARALRIFPALAACAFGTALVMGPFVTTLPLARYFATWDTWRFALQNSVTWPFGVRWWLPGVFAQQPGGPAVNGALWSLPWELTMYVLLGLLGFALLGSRPRFPGVSIRVVIVGLALAATVGHGLNEAFDLSRRFEVVQGLRLVALFFTAGALQLYRDRVPLGWPWFLVALVALPAVLWSRGGALVFYPLVLGYVVLWLALVPGGPVRQYNRLGDFSYGFYLWQFPFQQCIVHARPHTTQIELVWLAVPVTLVLAVASWHLVEKPALRLKDWPGVNSARVVP